MIYQSDTLYLSGRVKALLDSIESTVAGATNTYATTTSMKAISSLTDGTLVLVKNPLNGGPFRYNASLSGFDEGTRYAATVLPGGFERIYDGVPTISMFGGLLDCDFDDASAAQDSGTDNTAAFTAAFNSINAGYIPGIVIDAKSSTAGRNLCYRIDGTLPTITKSHIIGGVVGDVGATLYFTTDDATHWGLQLGELYRAANSGSYKASVNWNSNFACRSYLSNFTIRRKRAVGAATKEGNGIRTTGRLDFLHMERVTVEYCNGTGLSLGDYDADSSNGAMVRESILSECEFIKNGNPVTFAPNVRVSVNNTAPDGTKNIKFLACKWEYPFYTNIDIYNQDGTTNQIADIQFIGCMIHGTEVADATVNAHNVHIRGNTAGVNFTNSLFNRVQDTYSLVYINDDGTSSNEPTASVFTNNRFQNGGYGIRIANGNGIVGSGNYFGGTFSNAHIKVDALTSVGGVDFEGYLTGAAIPIVEIPYTEWRKCNIRLHPSDKANIPTRVATNLTIGIEDGVVGVNTNADRTITLPKGPTEDVPGTDLAPTCSPNKTLWFFDATRGGKLTTFVTTASQTINGQSSLAIRSTGHAWFLCLQWVVSSSSAGEWVIRYISHPPASITAAKTANYTSVYSDDVVLHDMTGGVHTHFLPDTATVQNGYVQRIIITAGSANLTINNSTSDSENVNGAASVVVTAVGLYLAIWISGSGWFVSS